MREENTASDKLEKPASSPGCASTSGGAGHFRGARLAVSTICLVGLALFALRLTAPSNFLDQDQERPAAYVLDIIKNGNWLCQHDLNGDVMSKPPFYNWIAALLALPPGRVTLFSLYAPGAAAALGTALLLFCAGRGPFGVRAAFFGALASMLTPAALKEFGLARTDGVFAFTVTAAALAAYRAWVCGKGWLWFWLLGAVATLTKGPLGLLLAAIGLLAPLWERIPPSQTRPVAPPLLGERAGARGTATLDHQDGLPETTSGSDTDRKSGARLKFMGSHLLGIALFLLIAGGWFWLAYLHVGKPLADKFFGQELASAAISEGGHRPGTLFYRPPLYYLGRAAPWSVLAWLALWRVCRRPAAEVSERRLERFLFCWFVGGLFIFGMAPHQRADLLWPIMPAAALLAGREVARFRARLAHRTLRIAGRRCAAFDCAFAVLVVLMLCGYVFNYFGPQARTPIVRQTLAVQALAAQLAREPGAAFPLWHTDDPMALQIYLNTWRPRISFERAAALLRGPDPAFVAVSNPSKIEPFRKPDDPPFYTVTPPSVNGFPCPLRILGNRPQFE